MTLKIPHCILFVALAGCSSVVADQWNVTLTGPDTAYVGSTVQLVCNATCYWNSTCSIAWLYNEGVPPGNLNSHMNLLTWVPTRPVTHTFTCVTKNGSEIISKASKTVVVKANVSPTGPPGGSDALQTHGLVTVMLSLGLLLVVAS